MIHFSDPRRDLGWPEPLVDHATRRERIEIGTSGAVLERLFLPDAGVLVSKYISPRLDWMMRATGDRGRAAELWTSGTMQRCPPQIDAAIVRIEDDGADGWTIYMEDVAPLFASAGSRFPLAEARRLLDALGALHEEFWLEDIPGLAALEDLLALCSPAT